MIRMKLITSCTFTETSETFLFDIFVVRCIAFGCRTTKFLLRSMRSHSNDVVVVDCNQRSLKQIYTPTVCVCACMKMLSEMLNCLGGTRSVIFALVCISLSVCVVISVE